MVFNEKLPELHDLCRIAGSVKSYPVSPEELAKNAKDLGYGKNVIDFINLFIDRKRGTFESRSNFYTRAAELALLICEEREQPKENFLSPQD